ncbi:MAG: DUF2497 domain-containing protein [Pseudomonadota bacterium]
MSQTKEDNEPSMEEILASIRKIISDDEPEGPPPVEIGSEDDVLELTEAVEVEEDKDKDAIGAPAESASEPDTKVEPLLGIQSSPAKSERSEDLMEPAQKQDTTLETSMAPDAGLSSTTESAVTSALASFTGQVSKEKQTETVPGGGVTLETLVREAIEPQLKSWMDENLEKVVERVVRDEVRRLARRAEDA